MVRKLRIQYAGAIYHVMSRGNRREDIFLEDVDRQDFLKTLAEARQETGWQVHAYCLMRNLTQDTPAARQEFERRMEARRLETGGGQGLKALRRGWCLGSEDFKRHLIEEMDGKLGEFHSGEPRRETAEAKAERIAAEELGRLGWKEADLLSRRKSDPARLGIAARLRRETPLPIKAIARRMHLGTSKSANIRLDTAMTACAPADPAQGRPEIQKKTHHVMADPCLETEQFAGDGFGQHRLAAMLEQDVRDRRPGCSGFRVFCVLLWPVLQLPRGFQISQSPPANSGSCSAGPGLSWFLPRR